MQIVSNSSQYLVIDDFYDENELKDIWKELDFLTHSNKMSPPDKSASARDPKTLKPLKKSSVIFLDDFYRERRHSNILTHYEKIYSKNVIDEFAKMDNEFRYARHSNFDRTLVSYYDNSDYYKPHYDIAHLTYLYWICKEPKAFSGGDLVLTELDTTIEYKSNRLVVFPSYYMHSVLPVEMLEEKEPFSGYGRYCITTFTFVVPTAK
jgi:hypothetical protein